MNINNKSDAESVDEISELSVEMGNHLLNAEMAMMGFVGIIAKTFPKSEGFAKNEQEVDDATAKIIIASLAMRVFSQFINRPDFKEILLHAKTIEDHVLDKMGPVFRNKFENDFWPNNPLFRSGQDLEKVKSMAEGSHKDEYEAWLKKFLNA